MANASRTSALRVVRCRRPGHRSRSGHSGARPDRHALAHLQQPPADTDDERSALIAINNAQADLQAGFTAMRDMGSHGNGYGDVDVRNAINWGDLDGPDFASRRARDRLGAKPPDPSAPVNPLASIVIRTEEEARAAVREHVDRGVDWIKLYPTGGYSFSPTGEPRYVLHVPIARAAGACG